MELSPFAACRALPHALNNAHVCDSIVERRRHRRVGQYGSRKCVGLQCVLVANFKLNFRCSYKPRLTLQPNPARPVARRVKRDLNLDPTAGAKNIYSLVGGDLGTASKRGRSTVELQYGRC